MENYLMLNGKQINLTEEQVSEIQQSFGISDIQLSSLKPGETFKIGKYEFFVLEQHGDATSILLKDLLHENEEFGSNNNYDGSNVDKLCQEFGKEIEKLVGEDNIIEHTVDLTADDGLWWWTATAYSTPKHENEKWIKCVSPDGGINCNYCNSNYGVRPFCILKSNIFVSK